MMIKSTNIVVFWNVFNVHDFFLSKIHRALFLLWWDSMFRGDQNHISFWPKQSWGQWKKDRLPSENFMRKNFLLLLKCCLLSTPAGTCRQIIFKLVIPRVLVTKKKSKFFHFIILCSDKKGYFTQKRKRKGWWIKNHCWYMLTNKQCQKWEEKKY